MASSNAEHAVAVERDGLVGNGHLDAELLRLAVGAAHQRHSGNAGREAEIIFNPRRGAGLAAERAAVEDEHGKALRAGIDRGGEPGRAGTDDHHVEQPLPVERSEEADAASERILARVAQELPARTEDERQRFARDMETFDQGLRAIVDQRIELLIGVAVAAQEIDEPQHVPIAGRSDDSRSRAGFDQADAAQDERAHDPLAKLRLGDEQSAQPVRRDGERLDLGQRGRIDEEGTAGELGQLAEEGAALVADDVTLSAGRIVLGDFNLAADDDGKARANLAHPHDGFAGREAEETTEARDPGDLGRRQPREHLRTARRDERVDRLVGHGESRL